MLMRTPDLVFNITGKMEIWKIVKGIAEVQLEEKLLLLKEYDSIVIPIGAKHRVKALGGKCIILEISYGRFNEATS